MSGERSPLDVIAAALHHSHCDEKSAGYCSGAELADFDQARVILTALRDAGLAVVERFHQPG